jgi:predicted N-acyltransferase
MAELQARWHGSIAEIPEAQWQAVTAASGLPFYSWHWLERLEASGSIVPSQGWQSVHLGIWREESLLAVAPLYLKGHSYGEFVFDQSFAQLAGQLGLRYYPKLLGMSPLSPVLGYRFHIAPGEDESALTTVLLALIEEFAASTAFSVAIFSTLIRVGGRGWRRPAGPAG